MKYEVRIQEHTTYWQSGTVLIEAKSEKEARKKALAGDYEHTGDNEVDYDTEGPILKREIISIETL